MGGGLAAIVIGMFLLVWIISAVVKVTQQTQTKSNNNNQSSRNRNNDSERKTERTSSSDIDRFMAEIDRLRNKGTTNPPLTTASRSGQSSTTNPPPLPSHREQETRKKRPQPERRQKGNRQQSPAALDVPVLKPIPEPKAEVPLVAPVSQPISKPSRNVKPASPGTVVADSAVVQTIQGLMSTKNGRAAAFILAEVLGEPRSRRPIQHKPS